MVAAQQEMQSTAQRAVHALTLAAASVNAAARHLRQAQLRIDVVRHCSVVRLSQAA
jgi:hypothetical protein